MSADWTQRFTVTEEHIKLLRCAVVRWEDCGFGAPAIDCKRPYGNSSVVLDMAEILDVAVDEDNGVSEADEERLTALHAQTETALQIFLATGQMTPATYEASRYGTDWRRLAEPSDE